MWIKLPISKPHYLYQKGTSFYLTCTVFRHKLLSPSHLSSCITIGGSAPRGKSWKKVATASWIPCWQHWGCDTAAWETLLAPSQASFLFDYIPMGCLGSLNAMQDFKAKEGRATDSTRKLLSLLDLWEKKTDFRSKVFFNLFWFASSGNIRLTLVGAKRHWETASVLILSEIQKKHCVVNLEIFPGQNLTPGLSHWYCFLSFIQVIVSK